MVDGVGWWVLDLSLLVCRFFSFSSSLRVVSKLALASFRNMRLTPSIPARILLRRGDQFQAHQVMSKIYAFAKPQELDLKVFRLSIFLTFLSNKYVFTQVKLLQLAVKRSVEITQNTTLIQRFKSVILDPVNRRGLSVSHTFFFFS
jgi:hypothetical protein